MAAGFETVGWVAAPFYMDNEGFVGFPGQLDPELIQPTVAEAVCLAGLVSVEGRGEREG